MIYFNSFSYMKVILNPAEAYFQTNILRITVSHVAIFPYLLGILASSVTGNNSVYFHVSTVKTGM